jgi:DNA-binding NtrC family response regulator
LDDEAWQLEIFRDMFGAEFDVRTATTPDEARRMLVECVSDIIISDQKMPKIEGTDFLREVMRTCPSSFRILLTGQISVSEVMSEFKEGVIHAFLAKPWMEERMREMLERAHTFFDQ